VKKAKKIVIVGGGSNAWTPNIVKDMLLTPAIAGSEFVLYDLNKAASDLVATFLKKLEKKLRTGSTFVSTDSRARAFDGGDYFIVTISTGGLKAMAHDLAIPEEFGIYHTVGDTSGPGGWARTLRNFPVFLDLAAEINRRAPGAMVLNYTNPMTTLTSVLARTCAGPVVGLCHGVFENLAFLTRLYGLDSESEISVDYAGLNHFFWSPRVRARGKDVAADLLRRVRKQGFTALMREVYRDSMGHSSNRELATALFDETGVMPYLGDRHTCEFFPCYITDRAAMKRYKLVRTTIEERWQGFRQRDTRLKAMVAGEIPEGFLSRSRETAADIVSAHITGNAFIDVGNVPNIGQVPNLPYGTVLETAVRVDSNGFAPICFGDLPQPVLAFVEPYANVFDTTVEACFQEDRALALRALRMDPACSRLTGERVTELGERLIGAHKAFVKL
jgi:alpha-galactosidase/6-phospho-beta-glucosidase family protein